ncbi:hypothetical protein [Limnothrix redekei]|uniref:Uncharacterized protein n=1 Tax=Limnothrix redekei LRLZ20PSL1 TaxID=3112953 RepID=A0ABW7CAL9_9CYAN
MTDPIHTNSPVTNSPIDSKPGHRSQVWVRIRVPSNYRPDPVISTSWGAIDKAQRLAHWIKISC